MATTDTTTPQTATKLTGFQRDLLFVIAAIGPASGQTVKEEIEPYYETEINHGRLYPNLDTLVDHGLAKKGERDRRTNEYELTERGVAALEERRAWETQCLEGMEA